MYQEISRERMKTIGNRLREARGELSIADVCQAAGITQNALKAYEAGERIPRDSVKYLLARVYRKSVAELFFH